MEYRVNQIRSTRENIQMKHILSLHHVEKEIHKIMPNSLTETQLRKEVQDPEGSSLEQIKQELDDVDRVFALGFQGGTDEN